MLYSSVLFGAAVTLSVALISSRRAFAIKINPLSRRSGALIEMKMARTTLPIMPKLNAADMRIVLASGSPRRKELLQLMGIERFDVMISNFEEDFDHNSFPNPSSYCLATARQKVQNVARSLQEQSPGQQLQHRTLVIGADTIVEVGGKILEKPVDDADAKRMLGELNGANHRVHTAVVGYSNFDSNSGSGSEFAATFPIQLTAPSSASATTTATATADEITFKDGGAAIAFVETTTVTFTELTEADIAAYVATGEGRDKAGSYGIQGIGSQLVRSVDGCYFNVMGFPVQRLSAAVAQLFSQATAANATADDDAINIDSS